MYISIVMCIKSSLKCLIRQLKNTYRKYWAMIRTMNCENANSHYDDSHGFGQVKWKQQYITGSSTLKRNSHTDKVQWLSSQTTDYVGGYHPLSLSPWGLNLIVDTTHSRKLHTHTLALTHSMHIHRSVEENQLSPQWIVIVVKIYRSLVPCPAGFLCYHLH